MPTTLSEILIWTGAVFALGFALRLWLFNPKSTRLEVGDTAPDFVLPTQTGESIQLYDLLDRQHVVLYFYLQDFTPG